MVKKFDKNPKKPQPEDSGSESEDSEIETLPEEVEEEANRQKKKLLTRRHRADTSGASGSGASTSTSAPPSDIYRPPTAETGAIPKRRPQPPEGDSTTPSDLGTSAPPSEKLGTGGKSWEEQAYQKLLSRRHRAESSGASGSGASTSTSTPPSDIYRPPTAATGAKPEKSALKPGTGTGPPEWDSRTPSPFVQQYRDPRSGRPDWSAMREAYKDENRAVQGEESAEERGKYLAAKSRVQTSQALESGRQSRQFSLLQDKLKKGFVYEPHGNKVAKGTFKRQGFEPDAHRERLKAQDRQRASERQARYGSQVTRRQGQMGKPKKYSEFLPIGRLGYGPPLAAEPNQRREPMKFRDVTAWKYQLGQQETPEHWGSRDRDFAERYKSLSEKEKKIYQKYRDAADPGQHSHASRRLNPTNTQQGLQHHSKSRAQDYLHEARKNAPMERGGRRDKLYKSSALKPAESKLKDEKISAIPEENPYYQFEPFSEDPLTPRPSWPPNMPDDDQMRAAASATYSPLSARQRRSHSGTDLSEGDVSTRVGTPGPVQPLNPSWLRSPTQPRRFSRGNLTFIEMRDVQPGGAGQPNIAPSVPESESEPDSETEETYL